MADVVTSVVVGIVLVVLGRWGSRNAFDLTPPTLPEVHRHRRERVLLRGAFTCQLIGAVFLAIGLIGAVL